MTLYGRSDVITTTIGDHAHTHKRVAAPASYASDRTLPVEDCVECAPTLLIHGWKDDPRKVTLTPDEIEAQELAAKEGDALMKVAASQFGDVLARGVREMQESSARQVEHATPAPYKPPKAAPKRPAKSAKRAVAARR